MVYWVTVEDPVGNENYFTRATVKWYEWMGKDMKLFVKLFSQTSFATFIAHDRDGTFFTRANEWYAWLGNDMELFVTLFSHNSMSSAIADDDEKEIFYSRADEWFTSLGEVNHDNKQLFVKLFSRPSFPAAVNGDGHKLFKKRALQLSTKLNNDDNFAKIMNSNSIVSRLKNKEDEDFFNLIYKWMPRLKYPTILQRLEKWFVRLGEPFFEFVESLTKSKRWGWSQGHSIELAKMLGQDGRVTEDNLMEVLGEICPEQ